jgi:hypothetical protein
MNTSLTFTVDKAGFPIMEHPDLDFAIYWFPITKIQFECFIVDTGHYDFAWYDDKLKNYNGRISPGSTVTAATYWQLFMTGILPGEAQSFASWCGRGFDLPTSDEWKKALKVLAAVESHPSFVERAMRESGITERAKVLIGRLEQTLSEETGQLIGGRKLCDQMAMRLGVIEYVYENKQRNTFVGWGQPSRAFYKSSYNPLNDSKPAELQDPLKGARIKHWGFRLIRKG